MKTKTFTAFKTTYQLNDSRLPWRYMVVGRPHMRPAFAYLSDTYGDDKPRLNDCHSYSILKSLKQVIEFVQNPTGHKGVEAAVQVLKELERYNIIEEYGEDDQD